jgi:putative FmdB family regulatory protein
MPIYEYRCSSCGFQNDYLQKVSEPQLTDCPECKQSTFAKQVTAAGFQLKGTGWYATDFKNKGSGKGTGDKAAKPAEGKTESADSGKAKTESADSGGAKPDAAACGAGACAACT